MFFPATTFRSGSALWRCTERQRRRGLTVIELLFAVLIMAIVAASLQAMIGSVKIANDYSQGYGTATQHARVAFSRIEAAIHSAYGKSIYPGVWVTQDTDGQWTYPNTLIVWQPSGTPANPAGPPLVQELVIFCPDPNQPNDLVQLTVPGNTTSVPTTTSAAFTTLINSLKTSTTANKIVLTNLLNVVSVSGSSGVASRPAVRFVVTLHAVGRRLEFLSRRLDGMGQFALAARNVSVPPRDAKKSGCVARFNWCRASSGRAKIRLRRRRFHSWGPLVLVIRCHDGNYRRK